MPPSSTWAITEWIPQELFPIIPPKVQWLCVAGSGPKMRSYSSSGRVEVIQYQAGLHPCSFLFRIDVKYLVVMPAKVHHNTGVGALPRQAGATTAGKQVNIVFAAKFTVLTISSLSFGKTTPAGSCR